MSMPISSVNIPMPQTTASSILSNNAKVSAHEESTNFQTQDSLVKSEKEDPALSKNLFKKVDTSAFHKFTDKVKDGLKNNLVGLSTGVGIGAGAVAGGVIGYNTRLDEVNALGINPKENIATEYTAIGAALGTVAGAGIGAVTGGLTGIAVKFAMEKAQQAPQNPQPPQQ